MRATFMTGAGIGGCARLLLLLALATGLAACGHKTHVIDAVGVDIGVALTAPSGTTLIQQGTTLEIDAVVSNDTSNKGVTWVLTPTVGSAQSSTTSKYVYLAPTGVVGAQTVTLTAISITDTTKYASVTITVNGIPTIPPPVLFPANLNIPYGAYFTVTGGTAPYAWTLKSGTLPAGLALDGSTSSTTVLSGTPTALGTSTFTLLLTDAATKTATVTATLTVNPQTACVLSGHFGYLFTGFRQGKPAVRAGSLNIATDGTITGVHDYKDSAVARVNEVLTDGTCTTSTQNRGTLRIVSASGVEQFDFGVSSSLAKGQLQENDGTPVIGSGQFFQQVLTAFTQASVAGDYGFGLIGVDAAGNRLGVIGRATVDATGVISGGVADSNTPTSATNATLTGTLTAPDANGRGTATLTIGALSLPIAYYVIDANTIYIASNDKSTSTARVAGRMTRQTGAGTLSAAALSGPSVVSLFGSTQVGGAPSATVTAGLLSGGAGGNLLAGFDIADRGAALVHQVYTASPYTVTANGRGTLSVSDSTGSRAFVLYLTGPGSGYILEPASTMGNWGILDQQVGAPFSDILSQYYVGGTVFAAATSPISLTPQMLFQEGSLSGNVTGTYAIDPASGRAIATVSRNILGGSGLVIYVVSTGKLVVVGDGVNSTNSQLAWLMGY